MKMRSYQTKVLDFYRKYRSKNPRQGSLVARFLPYWLLVGVIGAVLLALMHPVLNLLLQLSDVPYRVGVPEFVGVWIGLMVGMIARDWGYMIRHIRFWPVMREIVDWQKVDELHSP